MSLLAGLVATTAIAEDDPIETAVAHMGIGVGINFIHPTNADAQSSNGVVFAYRWHTFHSGWGPTFGLDWHSTNFTQPVGSIDPPLGSVRMRAVLAGIGTTRRVRRFSASANLSAGYSFNHLTPDSGVGPAIALTGVSLTDVHVRDSAVFRPDVAVWYDLTQHVGIGVSAAYAVIRPEEVMTTSAGSTSRELHADAFELTVGLVFGLWRKQ